MYLKEESLEWVLKHFLKFGDNNIFPQSFELDLIVEQWSKFKGDLLRTDIRQWNCFPQRRMLVPKSQFGFRPSTQLDLRDAFVYTGLVYEAGKELEESRISEEARRVFSWRFNPTTGGEMYSEVGKQWKNFESECRMLASKSTFVVVADIADFYPRLYHHPMENAISSASPLREHVQCIMRILKQLSFLSSYGIPVGCTASRLIAEVSLNDVDQSLAITETDFCRYVDDFRIFANSEGEAREKLFGLSKILFENHGLTLNSSKTLILQSDDFISRFLLKHDVVARKELEEKVAVILENSSAWMEYPTSVSFDDLDEEEKRALKRLNLRDLLEQELAKPSFDIGWVKFLIMALSQIGDVDTVELLLKNLGNLFPVISSIEIFLCNLKDLENDKLEEIGNRILDQIILDPIIDLEYYRMMLLSVFSKGKLIGSPTKLLAIYQNFSDQATRREIILALGKAEQRHWFLSQRKDFDDLRPWEKRAFIWSSSCLNGDERKYWLQSVLSRMDNLECLISKSKRIISKDTSTIFERDEGKKPIEVFESVRDEEIMSSDEEPF